MNKNPHLYLAALTSASLSILSGCTPYKPSLLNFKSSYASNSDYSQVKTNPLNHSNLVKKPSGSILLARVVPPISQRYDDPNKNLFADSGRVYAFVPTRGLENKSSFNNQEKFKITLSTDGKSTIRSLVNPNFDNDLTEDDKIKFNPDEQIAKGHYRIKLIQKNPRWYAPDVYFTARKLVLPQTGSSQRYLKGALGEGAIFMEKSFNSDPVELLVISSAKEFINEVGGINVSDTIFNNLKNSLSIGDLILIK